jgi:DNA-binding protein HU-beta
VPGRHLVGRAVAARRESALQHAKQVAERTGLDTSQAKLAVDATIAEITAQLAAGNEVKFTGFGKFSAVARPAREGRNPQTGETMTIAAKKKAVNG